ncbi:putative glycosyltransferase [Dulcicalothrix desertica PCC 7102]|uniref:Putative glycosyltransferase n=1 Tax=Dulcicalothrix desertica PCC 7102 TaxID=232991 RepID=A0A3S1AD55_9CYAN|nr:glycosyltransferase [Dulcicalothrix desertica]RUS98511.1 putative glycosyltransferase [Dulcicalothrix desertica PCC 7102]TWH54915.1 GT2 family glycosyltransferase [Dulcicalothrix desertica PCC 7102]
MYTVDIITLTKNSEDSIKATLFSVSSQSYKHINHIIIDGSSEDKTIDSIHEFNHEKNCFIHQQSGIGIGNAFNNGLKKSFGDLVIFLNSGDIFIDKDVVTKIVDSYSMYHWLWAFGETISVSRKGYFKRYIKQYDSWTQELFLYGNPICHQSTCFSQEILKKVGLYNEDVPLEMDYEFNIRASLISEPYLLEFPISYYDTSGISSVKVFKSFKIHQQIRKRYFFNTPFQNLRISTICLIKTVKRFIMIPIKQYL